MFSGMLQLFLILKKGPNCHENNATIQIYHLLLVFVLVKNKIILLSLLLKHKCL